MGTCSQIHLTFLAQFNYNNLSKSSGIYIIFNNHNWRIYVGSTIEFKVRWQRGHYLSLLRNKHSNRFLQADFNRCKEELGHDDFLEFHVLENMPDSSREERLANEEKWLKISFDNGKRCYNLCDRAISRENSSAKNPEETKKRCSEAAHKRWNKATIEERKENTIRLAAGRSVDSYLKVAISNTGKITSKETREKISKIQLGKKLSEEHKQNIGKSHFGKSLSEEHKRKLSIAKKGKKSSTAGLPRKPMSEETKKKISETKKKSIGDHFPNIPSISSLKAFASV